MTIKRSQLPLRLDSNVKRKLQYIADNNFRPVNKEIERLIINYIADYESQNGEIILSDEE